MKKLGIIFVAMVMAGCTASNQQNGAVDTAHTAQNSLDWAGVYKGTLPCADCEGIETILTLNYDNTFKLEEAYKKGIVTFMPQAEVGTIQWGTGSLIHISNRNIQRTFFVGEGRVEAYDMEGNPIESELNYTLKQIQVSDGTINEQTMIKEIEVGPKLVDCQGVGPMQCLLVKQQGDKDWSLHYEAIDGFDYQPGFKYKLKIEEVKNDNVPADRSSITWKLVSILSKTPA